MNTIRHLFLLLLLSLPVIFFPFTYLAFEMPKVFALYLFSSVVIYFLLVSSHYLSYLRNLSNLSYLIFFAWIVFTSITGLSFEQSFLGSYFRWQGIMTLVCYSLLFFISGSVFSENHFRKQASIAIVISSVFTATLAIIEFASLWLFGNTSQLLYSGRVISTFGQPNFLGAFLVMSLPFAWYLFKQILPVSSLRANFIGAAILLIVLGIISTLSRSSYAGLGTLLIIWGVYHRRLFIAGIISLTALLAFSVILFPNLFLTQWLRLKVEISPVWPLWTAENRLVIARKSVELIAQKPLTGYGLENFSLAFPNVVNQNDLGLKDIVVDSSHNIFLDIAAQAGLIGLAIFVFILILTIKSGLKQNDDFIKACVCVLITFLIMHQFSPVSIVPMVLFWICMGIINPVQLKQSVYPKNIRVIFQFFGISLIILTSFFIIQTIRADIIFRNSSAYEVIDIHKSIKLDNEAIKIAPWINFYTVRKDFLLKQLGY